MRFRIETWTIANLIAAHNREELNLNPPYQRRFIWSLEDQRILIESIYKNYPIPNIFLKENAPGNFEVVDGQQRLRTIIAFRSGQFTDFENRLYNPADYPNFDNFIISTIIIEMIGEDDIAIHDYYGLVNSAGVHLNRPEIKKAEFYETVFLRLINACNDYANFRELGLFTETVLKRMNDMDFVSELVVLLKDGITDKKDQIDRTFESDITEDQYNVLYPRFTTIIDKVLQLNAIFPIRRTRYKQRNDFYTLFGFLKDNDFSIVHLTYIYKILVLIANDISPSNDDCISFQNYARNCVTQSNSRNARLERKAFFDQLFLNTEVNPNATQRDILSFYGLTESPLTEYEANYSLPVVELHALKPSIIFNS